MVLIVETTLRTKSLCLIYDEQAEIQFSNKYKGYESINCFLNLENMIENVCNKYASIEGLPEDKRPFAQSLMGEEIKKVTEKFGKKKKGKQMCKFENRLEEAYSNKSYTFVQDLEEGGVTSVKANACKKQTTVKFSTRFISSKLLINAKISLASFIYDCIDTFCFPNEETQKIYDEHNILKVLPYLLMTDMDFASLKFIVIADKACDLDERGMREVLLKIFLDNNIPKRLNLSSNVFDQFGKRNERIRKQVGLYEFENICVCPKEYFELHGILYEVNEKHKEVRKGIKRMDFDNYADRILHIDEAKEGTNRFTKKANKHVSKTRKVTCTWSL